MKLRIFTAILACLLLSPRASGVEVKLGDLPLGSAANTNPNDSFPYVDSVANVTRRLTFEDIINLPSLVATYATSNNPVFTGNVNFPGLTASLPVQTDASKNLVSAAINLSGSQATGTLAAGRFPALLADVTNTAGSLTTTISKIQGTTVTGTTGSGSVAFSNSPSLTTPSFSSIVNSGTLTLPTSTDTLIGKATSDILTNKTLATDGTNFINLTAISGATGTGSVVFSSSPSLTSPSFSSIVNTGTLTLPTSTDTLVGKATSDTFTNKSLSTNGTNSIDSTTITGTTGSGSVVFSASPQFSGNVGIGTAGASGVPLYVTGGNIAISGNNAFINYGVGTPTASNIEYMFMQHSGASGAQIAVQKSGTGSLRPLNFLMGGSTVASLDTSGNLSATSFVGPVTGTSSGNTTITPSNHAVAISSSTNALSTAAPTATTGIALVSNGSSSDPSFSALNLASGSAVTGILSNSNTTAASANTASAIVARDASGNFTAGTITSALVGTASGNTTITPSNHAVAISSSTNALSTAATSATSGVALVSNGSSSDPSFGAINLASGSAVTGILSNSNTTAASANTASAIVARDSSGNFSAATITSSALSISGDITQTGNNYTVSSSSNTATIKHGGTTGKLVLDGDSAGGGGEITLFGASHGSTPKTITMNADNYFLKNIAGTTLFQIASNISIPTLNLSIGANNNIVGSDGTSDATSGNVGQYNECTQTTPTNVTSSNAFQDMCNITIGPGDFDISMIVYYTTNGATVTQLQQFIGTASGNNTTGRLTYSNTADGPPPSGTYDQTLVIPNYRVRISGSTTYYGKVTATFSAGNPQFQGRLSSRRMR